MSAFEVVGAFLIIRTLESCLPPPLYAPATEHVRDKWQIPSSLYFLQCNNICSALSVILTNIFSKILHSKHSSDWLFPNKNYILFNPVWSNLVKTDSPLLFFRFTPLIDFCTLQYFLLLLSVFHISFHFFIISFLIIALVSPLPKGIFVTSLILVDFVAILFAFSFPLIFTWAGTQQNITSIGSLNNLNRLWLISSIKSPLLDFIFWILYRTATESTQHTNGFISSTHCNPTIIAIIIIAIIAI